jgi:hypothetical protein
MSGPVAICLYLPACLKELDLVGLRPRRLEHKLRTLYMDSRCFSFMEPEQQAALKAAVVNLYLRTSGA